VGANGNNVDLRKETMAAMQTAFQYQMLTRAVNDRMSLVRTAAGAS
jgi:flagellar basal-body rod protein FlgB